MEKCWRTILGLLACTLSCCLPALISADAQNLAGNGSRPGTTAARLPISVEKRALDVLHTECLSCHGAVKTSGLDLRSYAALRNGGQHGAILVPGSAEKSRLYRYVAGLDKIQMPPAKRLTAAQIAVLKSWIDAGAKWDETGAVDTRPWAFRPPQRSTPPNVKQANWVKNPVDAFVLARLESKGLHPAPPADRVTLIRRLSFDVIGLPPSPAEIAAFVHDKSPDAYERLVDRLLASPHYGERWARHWLDLCRYAESEGFKSDEMRPNAWRFRDYVVQSLNADKPYDRFIKEQLAGDELYPDNPDALIATGFCRHWADESNARDLAARRQEILNDITDTTGSTLLGLTVGCARCHNHKYDPIPQKDYYRLQAFFAAVQPRDDLIALPAEGKAEWQEKQSVWEEKTRAVRTELDSLESKPRHNIYLGKYKKFPDDVKAAIDTAPEKRTSLQWLLFHKAEPQLEVTDSETASAMNGAKPEIKARWTELRATLESFKPLKPDPLPRALGITDVGPVAPKTFTLAVGVYDKPVEEVEPGFLSAVTERSPQIVSLRPDTTGRRTALANWIADPSNPLTARVIVNRLWQYHFGRGIVPTSSDFGSAGERATHPELLDWLATELVRTGWSLKQINRLILTSAAYRQSSTFDARAARLDPDNMLLWRFPRQRLEGEVLRDAMLAVSGSLNEKMGGPGAMAELPSGITTRGYWKEASEVKERNRRSIYLFVKRNLRYPLFEAFDFPDTHEPCARRQVTTTPIQALLLLNDDTALRLAQSFAGRVWKEAGDSPERRVTVAYNLAYGRQPRYDEVKSATSFLDQQTKLVRRRLEVKQAGDDKTLLPDPFPADGDKAAGAALVDLCHALFNSNEFLFVE